MVPDGARAGGARPKLIEPLPDDALRRLIDAASTRDRAIVLAFLDTGLRLSELAGIRRIDLRADGTIKVRGKGARERIVPVGNAARQALLRYLRQERTADPEAAVFRSRNGGPLGWRGIQQVFNRLKARAGIVGRCSPHTLRHTFARAYLVNGGDALTLLHPVTGFQVASVHSIPVLALTCWLPDRQAEEYARRPRQLNCRNCCEVIVTGEVHREAA